MKRVQSHRSGGLAALRLEEVERPCRDPARFACRSGRRPAQWMGRSAGVKQGQITPALIDPEHNRPPVGKLLLVPMGGGPFPTSAHRLPHRCTIAPNSAHTWRYS